MVLGKIEKHYGFWLSQGRTNNPSGCCFRFSADKHETRSARGDMLREKRKRKKWRGNEVNAEAATTTNDIQPSERWPAKKSEMFLSIFLFGFRNFVYRTSCRWYSCSAKARCRIYGECVAFCVCECGWRRIVRPCVDGWNTRGKWAKHIRSAAASQYRHIAPLTVSVWVPVYWADCVWVGILCWRVCRHFHRAPTQMHYYFRAIIINAWKCENLLLSIIIVFLAATFFSVAGCCVRSRLHRAHFMPA